MSVGAGAVSQMLTVSGLWAKNQDIDLAAFNSKVRAAISLAWVVGPPLAFTLVANFGFAWHFAAIQSPEVKQQIREQAEAHERGFYNGRAGQQWLDDLKPLGTDASKPYLETAPWLIAVFSQKFGETESGEKSQNYYVHESVGIAVGMLITSLHNAGLATLTHTPKPMNFLTEVCQRPDNERAYMLIIAGYPADNATIPAHAMQKKSLREIASFL